MELDRYRVISPRNIKVLNGEGTYYTPLLSMKEREVVANLINRQIKSK